MTHLVEASVSQLELAKRPPPVVAPDVGRPIAVTRIPNIPLDLYRRLYDAVGRHHHWTSRLLPDELLSREIHGPGMEVHVLDVGGEPAGWFELESGRRPWRTRIVHFGIMPDFRGKRLSRFLLSRAIDAAFATGAEVVTLETNTLDHPAALPLYLDAGFVCVERRLVATPAIGD